MALIGMVAASLARKGYGPAESRRILLRRYAWLGVCGLAHMFLLFYNEIMFAYGLVGVGLAVVYRMASKSLRHIAYVILGCFAAFCASGALGAFYGYFDPHSTRDQLSTDLTTFGAYFSANAHSAVGYVQGIWFIAIELFALAVIEVVWARERVLFDVHAHRRTLTTRTWIAAAVVLLVGVPWGLSINGVLPSELEPVFYMLNQGFGFLTGPRHHRGAGAGAGDRASPQPRVRVVARIRSTGATLYVRLHRAVVSVPAAGDPGRAGAVAGRRARRQTPRWHGGVADHARACRGVGGSG